MEYKLSKYTHITKHNGELIFFNSYMGIKSLIKADFPVDLNNIGPETKGFRELQEKGHIVNKDFDEESLIEELYLHYQNDRYLSLTILPNEMCNFRCEYCYESLKQREMQKKTLEAIVSYVKDNIQKYNSLHVSWYGGEPLLSIDIIVQLSQKFIEICRKHKKLYFASITTNGYFLDLDMFNKLKRCNVVSYQITLDGYRDIHDKQRPLYNQKGTYDVILNNLVSIKNNIKSRAFSIILRSNCSKESLNSFNKYVCDLIKYFSNDNRFKILIRPVMDWGGDRVKKMKDELIDVSRLNEFYRIFMEYDKAGALSYFTALLEPKGAACYAGYKNHITINSAGEIFKCTCDLNNDMNSKIGFIDDNSKFVIDRNDSGCWMTDIKYKLPQCKGCDFSPVCLYDFCPGKRLFKTSFSLPCPFEKYFLDTILILLSRNINLI